MEIINIKPNISLQFAPRTFKKQTLILLWALGTLIKKKFSNIFSTISNFDRILGNFIISLTLKKFVGLNIYDPTSGMRAYDKKAIIALKDNSLETFDNLTFYGCVSNQRLKLNEYQVDMMERKR